MKRDPFPMPIDLGKGPFKFVADHNFMITDFNFWRLARRVHTYRTENKIPVKTLEDVQLEILKQIRDKRSLPIDRLAAVTTESEAQKFVKKRYKGGCRTCGRKK